MIGTRILEERNSKHNGHLRVLKTWGLGTYIQAEGLTQSGGIVESIWKSTINKIKDKDVESCLILGYGGGTVAKLVRKNWPKAKIIGVDIDTVIVELGRKYLGLGKDIKVEISDAKNFVSSLNPIRDRYDLVIVDLYNGDKYPKKFESETFLKRIRKNKLVIFNRLYYGSKKTEADKFGEKLEKFFSKVEKYRPEANIMYVCTT